MRYYFLFFLLLVSYSCSREDQNPDSIRIDLSRSYGNEQLENIVDDIRLVPLETNDSCIVGQYDRVIVKGRSIFILDKMQNTVFCLIQPANYDRKSTVRVVQARNISRQTILSYRTIRLLFSTTTNRNYNFTTFRETM